MEDHIPMRPDRSLLLGRQISKWSLWDVIFHENQSKVGLFTTSDTGVACSVPKKTLTLRGVCQDSFFGKPFKYFMLT